MKLLTLAFSLMTTVALAHEANLGTLLATISQVKTGDKDFAVGKNGEVSRYQILPHVWIKYDPERRIKQGDATDPRKAAQIAGRILTDRISKFRILRGRNPTPADVYALWHRPDEAYRGKLKPTTRLRAERFSNLYFALVAQDKGQKK